ncbi:hypothetical protein [Photorhabdus bodei]|nr:hypothetical protein [Photorhabdus bodei]
MTEEENTTPHYYIISANLNAEQQTKTVIDGYIENKINCTKNWM